MDSRPVYIFGHRNPDADAICSAIAYESFKHACGETQYVAARCGNSNARIDAILRRFDCPLPRFIGDVTPRLDSIMTRDVVSVSSESTCAEALELIDRHDVRALPVLAEDRTLRGMLSVFQLGEFFIPKPKAPKHMRHVFSSISCIVNALGARVLNSVEPDRNQDLYVRVGAMDIRSFGNFHRDEEVPAEESVIVVGDRWDIQERSIQLGVRLLVITGDLEVEDEVIERAREKGVSLIISRYDSASTSFIIRTAAKLNRLMKTGTTHFNGEDKVSTVRRRVATVNEPLYFVTDEKGGLEGVFSKSDLLKPSPVQLVLVDHNELSQAVPGANEVQILEVIDHHRLGNSPTEQPILFVNRPVGSTCTIIADMFRGRGLKPDASIAGVLMGGIISDTLHLNGPTTTEVDRDILAWLESLANVSAASLAELIFSSGSIIISQDVETVVQSDSKIYEEGETRFSVSQVEELGFNNFWSHADALQTALAEYRGREQLLFSMLLITDINSQDSLLVVDGPRELLEQISFPSRHADRIFELKGIVSRKKQLIPYVTSLLKSIGMISA